MAAALSRSTRSYRFLFCADLLAQAGKCVILAQETDHRMTFSPYGADGCGHSHIPCLHLKSGVAEDFCCPFTCLHFIKRSLGIFPDLFSQIGKDLFILINGSGSNGVNHNILSFFWAPQAHTPQETPVIDSNGLTPSF